MRPGTPWHPRCTPVTPFSFDFSFSSPSACWHIHPEAALHACAAVLTSDRQGDQFSSLFELRRVALSIQLLCWHALHSQSMTSSVTSLQNGASSAAQHASQSAPAGAVLFYLPLWFTLAFKAYQGAARCRSAHAAARTQAEKEGALPRGHDLCRYPSQSCCA